MIDQSDARFAQLLLGKLAAH